MKPYLLLPVLFFFNFALSQEVYNAKTVDQFPIYPTCQDSINDLPNCFDKNLNEDVQKKLSAIKLDKIIKASGRIFTKVNFVINEEGSFSNIKVSGNEILGRIVGEVLLRINQEQTENNTKIIPAKVNGNSVKLNYSLPIEYTLK